MTPAGEGDPAVPGPEGGGALRLAAALELGVLLLLVSWLFKDALFLGGVYYKRDVHLVWHPQVEGFVRAVLSGAWPVWDESPAFGQPLLADPSAQVLYPLTWLNLLMKPWVFYTLFAVVHFAAALLGMRALARGLGLSRPAALLAAVAYSVSGPFISLVDLWHHYAGAALMPWVVLAAHRAQGGGRRHAVRFGLVLALQILAGSADLVAMSLLLSAAVAGRSSWTPAWPPSPRTRRALGRLAVGLLLGLIVSAALWMPALENVSRAARSRLPAEVRTYWSMHPLVALETALPGLWSGLPLHPELRTAFFESREPFLSSLYLGVGLLALVGSAALASRHPQRPVLLGALLVAFLFALGPHTPFYSVVTTLVPPLRILRYPVKAMVAAAFAAALLAGLGADAWRFPRSRRSLLLGALGPATFVLVAALGAAFALREHGEALTRRLLDPALKLGPDLVLAGARGRLLVPAALAATVIGLVLLFVRGRAQGTLVAAGLGLIAAGDLAAYHRHANPVAPVELYTHTPEIVTAIGDPRASRIYVYDYSVPGKIDKHLQGRAPNTLARVPEGWNLEAASALAMQMYLAPEAAGRHRISQAFNVDYRGLFSSPLHRFVELLRQVEGTPLHLRLLQAGGVAHTISLHALGDLTREREIEGLFERPILLERVPDPLPRAYVVGAATPATGEEAVARLLDEAFDVRLEVVLAEGPTAALPPGFRGEARWVEKRADRAVLQTTASGPGFLVVLESYDPGWRARIDGKAAPVLRANLAFRAVAVPPGEHRIELVYRPRGLLVGLAASALGLALAAVAWAKREGAA